MIELADVRRSLGETPALRGVRLAVAKGERLAIVGPSAAGKTTLFRVLNLTLRPDGGTYRLDGRDTAALHGEERRAARSGIATIHQLHDVVQRLTVLENVLAAGQRDRAELREQAVENMGPCGAQEPGGAGMAAPFVGNDQIGRIAVVELVDLVAALDDRDVPAEKIDEDLLAPLEHLAKGGMLEGRGDVVNEADHV